MSVRPRAEGAGRAQPGPAAREAWAGMLAVVLEGEGPRWMSETCGRTGLPPGAVKLAVQLRPGQARSMGELAGHLGCDASYVTGLVDELERAGVAERRTGAQDRRVRTVVLTETGERLVERIRAQRDLPPPAFAVLSPAELEQLRGLMARLRAAAAPVAVPGPPAPAGSPGADSSAVAAARS
jgi:DNA-binding MarR family transcriptional regulator